MLTINSNPLALGIANNLNRTNQMLQETSQRLATGKRIISAKDDPSGVGVLASMKAQSGSWNAVQKNLSSGQSLLEVANGALQNQANILQQMKEIATKASSDLLSASDRTAMQKTFAQLQTQLDTVVNRASIFGQNLVSATSADVNIQSGVGAGDTFTLTSVKSDATTLAVNAAAIDLTTSAKAQASMTALDAAISTVSGNQAVIGAQQNGLDALSSAASTTLENLDSSISRIEDADVAAESTKLAQLQAKQQLGIQMLGIINQLPSYALSLLR